MIPPIPDPIRWIKAARPHAITAHERDQIVAALKANPDAIQAIADRHQLSLCTLNKIRAKAGIRKVGA